MIKYCPVCGREGIHEIRRLYPFRNIWFCDSCSNYFHAEIDIEDHFTEEAKGLKYEHWV